MYVICEGGKFHRHEDTFPEGTDAFSISIEVGDSPVTIESYHYKVSEKGDDSGRRVAVFDRKVVHHLMDAAL